MKNTNLLLEKLYEAVIKTVNIHGFHGSSIALIAKQAQINTSNIYHYFSSKDELLMQTYIYIKEKIDAFIFAPQNFENTQNSEQEFKIVFTKYIQFYQQKSWYISFMEQFAKSPYTTLLKTCHQNDLNGEITRFLEKKIEEEHFIISDVRIMKAFIFGAINNITYHIFSQTKNPTSHKQTIADVVQMIWNAITYKHTQ